MTESSEVHAHSTPRIEPPVHSTLVRHHDTLIFSPKSRLCSSLPTFYHPHLGDYHSITDSDRR